MRILIIGSGGREHALAWKLAHSSPSPELFIAPGNAGTATIGQNVPIQASDIEQLRVFARDNRIDLTVVGPEQPLVLGIVDAFEADGLRIIGPSAAASRLEGSKAFAKAFMDRHGIPTAYHRVFSGDSYKEAVAYVKEKGVPIVTKTSGLAAGKGAIVCETVEDAANALDLIMRQRAFGEAGDDVVIEEYMEGEEASVFALTDGKAFVLLSPAQDHKRIGEGDTGPNTGGMGAYAPAPVITGTMLERVASEIIKPTLAGMAAEGYPYRGFLYCGLMITETGPRVVEFNCRLGDPEAQVVLPLLQSDLVELLQMQLEGRLGEIDVAIRDGSAVCVVLASEGYPDKYKKGFKVEGLQEVESNEEVMVFHAGTKLDSDSNVVTSGGRVLGVTAVGQNLEEALDRAYQAIEHVRFHGMQYRRDIGQKGLARMRARA